MSDVVSVESGLFSADKRRKIAIALAFAGSLPTPLPLTWLHKFYLGQYLWGIVYLVLAPTYIPKVACCLEGIWYLSQSNDQFVLRFPRAGALMARGLSTPNAETASQRQTAETAQQVAIALRELDTLRQEGLITEYEFEQKRRKLLGEID
ncbi:MAG: SHOCT domain-containing protein [Cyanobacteria bacterium J06623_4]